jgi:hypothetical protein
MANTPEGRIFDGLMRRLHALTLTPAMPIADPNKGFTPPATGYIRAQHFPNTAQQQELGDAGRNRFIGQLLLGVFVPLNTGATEASEIAGTIAAHFKRGTVITEDSQIIRILRPPLVAGGLPEKSFFQVPVTVFYQADASNPS